MNFSSIVPIRNRTVLLFFTLIGLILYLNSLNAPFHYDDIYFLKENLGIKSFSLFWQRLSGNISALFNGRPFLLLTFLVNYKLGGLQTLGYHLLNVSIHIGNAFFLYLILRKYVASDDEKELSLKTVLASVLFLIHPICTESVTYISSRSSELSALFVLLSMYCFFRATEHRLRAGPYLLSVAFFILGLMTKETAIVLPALLLLFDYFFISKGAAGLRNRLAYHVPHLFVLGLAAFVYASLITAPSLSVERPWTTHVLTELNVFTQYLRLLAVPVGLNIDHEVMPSSIIDGRVVISILILSALLFGAIVSRKKYPLFSFSFFWFAVNLLPFLLVRLEDFMAERWAYLASIGFCIALAELLTTITNIYRRTGAAVIAVVMLAGGALTVMRNNVYASPLLLWEDAAKKSPGKYRPLVNLSSAYMENGDPAKAVASAREAITLWKASGSRNDNILTAYLNLAAAYGTDQKAEDALKSVEKASAQSVDYHAALGALYMNQGRFSEALASFKKALALSPQSAAYLFLVGECYESLKLKNKAREYFVLATSVIPQTAQEYMGQGESFSRLGDYRKASERFHEAMRTDPLDVSLRVYFATILMKNERLDNAFEQFSLALRISPGYAPAYKGLGLVKLEQGEGGVAMGYFDKALALLPAKSTERKSVLELREKARQSVLANIDKTKK